MSYAWRRYQDIEDLIIGVQWDRTSSSQTLQQIDVDGNVVANKGTSWFDRHPLWGNRKRCILSPTGIPTFGSNARGDGLTLDGSVGQVMVYNPAGYVKAKQNGNYNQYWLSPSPYRGFEVFPWFLQKGGVQRGAAYIGAYLSKLAVKPDLTKYLLSASGKQPISGGEIVELSFTNGSSEPLEGDILKGATSLVQGTVIGYGLSSGSFGAGTAAGKVYLKLVDEYLSFNTGSVAFTLGQIVTGASSGATGTIIAIVVTSGSWVGGNATGYLVIRGGNGYNYTSAENITDPLTGAAKATSDGSAKSPFTNAENLQRSGSTIMAASGSGSALSFTRQNVETYANNINSARWGCESIWALDYDTLLYIIENPSWNSQSRTYGLGQGVVNKPWTRRFGGENTGSGSADSNIAVNGTGHAIGTDGLVHEIYRGKEDPWGNLWRFVIGLDALDASYRILRRDGLGVSKCPMDTGNYESSIAAPVAYNNPAMLDGYVTGLLFEDLTKYLFIPNVAGGSSSTFIGDYVNWHRSGQMNILLAGSCWRDGAYCGVGCRGLDDVSSLSYRHVGARHEYV